MSVVHHMAAVFPESRELLQKQQLERLNELVGRVHADNSFWAGRLAAVGFGVRSVGPQLELSWGDFQSLPLLTKSDLVADQQAHPPYGTNCPAGFSGATRMHQTSGTTSGTPLRWLDDWASWQWMLKCWAQLYAIAGLRPDDRLCFPFSFGPFLGFWAGFEGAQALGNLCIAAGGMSSQGRLALVRDHSVTWLACTPSYALRLAEVASQEGLDLRSGSVRRILVAGEPGGNIPETRRLIEDAWRATVIDHWGMTELGPLAIEADGDAGFLTMLETECIAEVLHPETWQPVGVGEVGELVVTNLGRTYSPVLRYRTGDLVRAAAPRNGDPFLRLEGGILGRADDMLIIRGNNVFPSAIESIIRRFPEVMEFQLRLSRERAMTMLCVAIEVNSAAADNGAETCEKIAGAIKQGLQFEAGCIAVPPGTLPRFEMKARRVVWG